MHTPRGKALVSFMKTNRSKHKNYLLLFYHEEYGIFYLPVKISCSLKANLILEWEGIHAVGKKAHSSQQAHAGYLSLFCRSSNLKHLKS